MYEYKIIIRDDTYWLVFALNQNAATEKVEIQTINRMVTYRELLSQMLSFL